jgi:hypothetical protein
MRKIILTAAGLAALLCFAAPTHRAAAMTVATPATLGVAATDLNSVQQVRWGWHRHGGWHRHWGWGWRRPWFAPPPVYWGYRPYWGGPWGPGPYYYSRPWGPPCCGWGWGWHRHWRRW